MLSRRHTAQAELFEDTSIVVTGFGRSSDATWVFYFDYMEFIDNVHKTLKDDMARTLHSGSKVAIAASCFSIFRQAQTAFNRWAKFPAEERTISEGKEKPDYSRSDFFRVELHLSATIQDVSFALFLESEQRDLKDEEKLSVFEVIALDEIRKNNSRSVPKNIIHKLLNRKLIEKRGQTSGTYYILPRSYYEFSDNKGEYSKKVNWDSSQAMSLILAHLSQFPNAKMRDFTALLEPHLSRRQVRSLIDSLVEKGTLKKNGIGSGTYYTISDSFIKSSELIVEALGIGLEELKKRSSQIQNVQKHVQTLSKNETKDSI